MYYKDDFYKEFRTEKELCEYLEEMAIMWKLKANIS